MNLLDYRKTSIAAAFERVRQEAAALDTRVLASEIVGLVPQAAILGTSPAELLLESAGGEEAILERRLERQSV
jgi:glutamate formiminotransferase